MVQRPAFVTGWGLDYAATSYHVNGVIVQQKDVKDLRALITAYTRHYGQPETLPPSVKECHGRFFECRR